MGYRSQIIVNLQTGFFIVAEWTVGDPKDNDNVGPVIYDSINKAEMTLAK